MYMCVRACVRECVRVWRVWRVCVWRVACGVADVKCPRAQKWAGTLRTNLYEATPLDAVRRETEARREARRVRRRGARGGARRGVGCA